MSGKRQRDKRHQAMMHLLGRAIDEHGGRDMFTPESYTPETLAARAEITDRILLYLHASDRRQWDLMELVFHDDAIWNMSSIGGATWRDTLAFTTKLFADHLLVTSHQIGNTMIRIDGNSALAEIYCTAYHRVRADAPLGGIFGGVGYEYDLIGGLRYFDRFEKRSGSWKIAERRGVSDWRHLQPTADGILSQVNPVFRGGHGENDPTISIVADLPRL
jgi:SnoaL-like domain